MTPNPPLLLLHGVTMSAAAWDDVTPMLTDRFDVIAPTAGGHRGGPRLAGRATISALTDTVERRLDEHGLDTVHIAGNSMGGWMAVELARRGRARSVCALSPAGLWTAGATHGAGRAMLHRTKTLADATRHVMPLLLKYRRVRRLAMADIAIHGDRLSARQAVHTFKDLVGCDAAADLLDTTEELQPFERLPCPVTVAWSMEDRIFPPGDFVAVARRRLPGARIVELPDVGHVPMIDNPALVAETIINSAESPEPPH